MWWGKDIDRKREVAWTCRKRKGHKFRCFCEVALSLDNQQNRALSTSSCLFYVPNCSRAVRSVLTRLTYLFYGQLAMCSVLLDGSFLAKKKKGDNTDFNRIVRYLFPLRSYPNSSFINKEILWLRVFIL